MAFNQLSTGAGGAGRPANQLLTRVRNCQPQTTDGIDKVDISAVRLTGLRRRCIDYSAGAGSDDGGSA